MIKVGQSSSIARTVHLYLLNVFPKIGDRLSRDFGRNQVSISSVEATRELCDDLNSLVEIAMQNRAPIRALVLIERARAELQAYLEEIDHRYHDRAAVPLKPNFSSKL